jgi:hypothetical protein
VRSGRPTEWSRSAHHGRGGLAAAGGPLHGLLCGIHMQGHNRIWQRCHTRGVLGRCQHGWHRRRSAHSAPNFACCRGTRTTPYQSALHFPSAVPGFTWSAETWKKLLLRLRASAGPLQTAVLLDAVAGLVNSLPLLYLVDVRHACDWRLAAIVLLFSVRAASAFGPPAAPARRRLARLCQYAQWLC